MNAPHLTTVPDSGLPDYPLGPEDRLDSHSWSMWQHRRWQNSSMSFKGSDECQLAYLNLLWISLDQTPRGTLPDDDSILAKMVRKDVDWFRTMRAMPYGPLHQWRRCRCGDEVRLYHPVVLEGVLEALSRRETNRARSEANALNKRLSRMRDHVVQFSAALARQDVAIVWMEEWVRGAGCKKLNEEWTRRAMVAWNNHLLEEGMPTPRG